MPISILDGRDQASTLGLSGLSRNAFGANPLNAIGAYSKDTSSNSKIGASGASQFSAREVAHKSKDNVLDQEDFLKLLTTQLAAQDPTKPVDNAEMVTQMSQLSMVESLNTINAGMADVISAVSASSALSASTLVGRSVLVDTNTGFFDGKNPIICKVNAGKGYSDIKITVKDANGNIVDEWTAPAGQGDMEFSWNGIKKPDGGEGGEGGEGGDGSTPEGGAKLFAEGGDTGNPGEGGEGGEGGDPGDVEYYDPGMYTITATGIDTTTGEATNLQVATYGIVGSISLGKTPADTMLNILGYGDIKLSDVKEISI